MRETSWEAGRLQVVRRYLTEMSETIKREREGAQALGTTEIGRTNELQSE